MFGFRKRRGTWEPILALKMILEEQLKKKRHLLPLWTLKMPFYHAGWNQLFKILELAEVKCRIIHTLYKSTEMQEVSIRCIRQGCPLSPMFSNSYLQHGLDEVRERVEGREDIKIHIERITD